MLIETNTVQKSVSVIGAGIAGCATAYALAKRGINVTLIERHPFVAQEASGNPAAMLYPKYNTGQDIPSQLSILGFEHTLKLLTEMQADDLTYQLCGQIQLAFNDREKSRLARTSLYNQLQIIDRIKASEIAGIPLAYGGLYLPSAGWVNPKRLCEQLTQSALIKKVMMHEAFNIRQTANQWQIETSKELVIASDAVVICNANDLSAFHQCNDIPITAVRGQVNFVNSNDNSKIINTILCSDHYLSPAINGQHSIGTSYGPNDFNPALSHEDTRSNLASIKTISPWLYEKIDQSNISGRVAWRSATKDYCPLAGQLINHAALKQSPPRYNDAPETLPWLAGLYINAGHGSKGMITAPLCAEIVAAMINGETLPVNAKISSQLNPSRFTLKAVGAKKLAQNLYPI